MKNKKISLCHIITNYTTWYIITHYKIENCMFCDNPPPLEPRTPQEIKEIKERLRGKKENENTIKCK